MGKNRHLFLQIPALTFRAVGLATAHYQGLKFLAAGTADKIK
jgi:hypothetical protein